MYPTVVTHCMLSDLSAKVVVSKGWEPTGLHIHTGVDINIVSIHSVCRGVVIYVGADLYETGLSIVIQYDVNQCVRYGHLKSVGVAVGQLITTGQVIGVADKFVHLEYLNTTAPEFNVFPLRIGKVTYYKYDPTGLVVNADKLLPDTNRTNVKIIFGWAELPLADVPADMKLELYGGRDNV